MQIRADSPGLAAKLEQAARLPPSSAMQCQNCVSTRVARFRTKGVPGTLFQFCLHAYCFHLMHLFGSSSSPISGEPIPPRGEDLAQWPSQGEEHAHAVRKRVRSWGVRRTKLYAFGAREGLEHRALGPSRLARVFFK